MLSEATLDIFVRHRQRILIEKLILESILINYTFMVALDMNKSSIIGNDFH